MYGVYAMKPILLILIVWNFGVFLLYGMDKLLAKRKMRRISEATLLTTAFCLGTPGALFGMVIFNHKTAKVKFRILVPLFFAIHVVFLWLLKEKVGI